MKVNTNSPIVSILIGDEEKALQISKSLLDEGIFIPAIRYPTVKKGQARLRATLMETHDFSDIDLVIDKLKKLNKK